MKKIFYSLVVLMMLVSSLHATAQLKNWADRVPIGNGNTILIYPITGKKIILMHVIVTVTNACTLYFYSDGASDTQISNEFHFGANGGVYTLDGEALQLKTLGGEGLGVNCDADPDTDIIFVYETIDS